ncbi:unnamed protein product [Ectocarpus sp. CCAP 1310/34]|nr:unnamed protein product [Ectocarpus sp. CCAP 1310/34]
MAFDVNRTFQQNVRPRLPLPTGNTWTVLVTRAGISMPPHGRQKWTSLAQQFLVGCVESESGEGPVKKILSIGRDLNDTTRDGKLNGLQGFAELVIQLTKRFTSFQVLASQVYSYTTQQPASESHQPTTRSTCLKTAPPWGGCSAHTSRPPKKKKSRSAPFGSRRRAARKLNQHKTKFEERTGQCMVATSAEDNTRRAIERGSLTVVERTLEETKEELVNNKKIV